MLAKENLDAIDICAPHGYHHVNAIKCMEAGVNVTVGLPVVRTSVDHGTAFDIAGKGIADERSLIEALSQAVELASRRTEAA